MSTTKVAHPSRKLNALEKNLLGTSINQIHLLLPGLLAAALLAWAATWLSEWVGSDLLRFEKTPISAITVAILLGLAINNALPLPNLLRPGLAFASKKVLRLGIILLGIRLSLYDVLELGITGVPVVLACILTALVVTSLLAKWLKLPERLGTLIAVGTSICGVSAIVATGPAIDAKDEEVAYAVSVITIFGIVASFGYPYLAYALFGGDPVAAGLFLGTAIHDTSQVTGAALVFADVFSLPRGVDVATVTKLVRNVSMALVIPLMALRYTRRAERLSPGDQEGTLGRRATVGKLLPLFVLGFLLLAGLRSVGDAGVNASGQAFGIWQSQAWKEIHGVVKDWAVNLLVVALAAVGLSTSARILRGLGIKPFVVGLGAAAIVGIASFFSISLLGLFLGF